MNRDIQKLVDQIRRQSTPAAARTMHQGLVMAVDTDSGTAEVMIGSEDVPEASAIVTINQQSGFLPREGDTVMVQMNGAEPIVQSPRTLVDGDIQSKDFAEGVSGWIITAEGNAEFNDVVVRGYVNNLKVHQPPMALLRHKAADYPLSIPDSAWTTLTDLQITIQNAAGPSGDPAYGIGYALSGSRVTPGRVGLWQITAKVIWDLNSNGAVRRLQIVNDTTSTPIDLDMRGPQGGLVLHSIHETIEVSDISHPFHLRVFHDAGAAIDILSVKWFWEFKSD